MQFTAIWMRSSRAALSRRSYIENSDGAICAVARVLALDVGNATSVAMPEELASRHYSCKKGIGTGADIMSMNWDVKGS